MDEKNRKPKENQTETKGNQKKLRKTTHSHKKPKKPKENLTFS